MPPPPFLQWLLSLLAEQQQHLTELLAIHHHTVACSCFHCAQCDAVAITQPFYLCCTVFVITQPCAYTVRICTHWLLLLLLLIVTWYQPLSISPSRGQGETKCWKLWQSTGYTDIAFLLLRLALAAPVAACYMATAASTKTIWQLLLALTPHCCHHECVICCGSWLIVAFQIFSAGLTDVAIAVIGCCMVTAATAATLLLSALHHSVHECPVVAMTMMIVLPSDTRTYGIWYHCHCSVRLAALLLHCLHAPSLYSLHFYIPRSMQVS